MTTFLTVLALVLVLFVIGQVMRVFELSAKLRGRAIYEVTEAEGKTQAKMMLAFLVFYFIFIIWQISKWGKFALPTSASEHGEITDLLMNVSWGIIIPVFIITHILLFWFGYKYVYNKDRRADFFAHSNKLELIWTVAPTIVLTGLILFGLNTWNDITTPIPEDDQGHFKIELYAKQFGWTARYAGKDNRLGNADVRFIDGDNPLGVDRRDAASADDIVVTNEFHVLVDYPIQFSFRSQDVIHSAYMPHFRAQMNCVPGVATKFKFTPTKTTAEMRKETGNPEFDYILLCNKICGAAHYNMQMKIVVDNKEDYIKWLNEQPSFMPAGTTAEVVEEINETETMEAVSESIEADISAI